MKSRTGGTQRNEKANSIQSTTVREPLRPALAAASLSVPARYRQTFNANQEYLKVIRRQKIWLAVVIAVNLALWLIPSDVVEQIARDRHTMLGRYSRPHFSWIVGVAAFSLVSFCVDWASGEKYKRRWFQVLATLLVLTPLLGAVDFLLRTPQRVHYIRDTLAYHRPVGAEYHRDYEDKPKACRTYPNPPAGYGIVNCALRTDERGFRNQTDRKQYDIVVLGDSFAEGSNVSDEHVWPVRLTSKSDLSIYNLGMSGYDQLHYLASLREYGLALTPRYVLCMIYEGNDFRSAKSDRERKSPGFSKQLRRYFKQSPLINVMDNLLIETFGQINCEGHVAGIELLDWLPLEIPEAPHARYYTFAPKQLRDLYATQREFSHDRHWLNLRSLMAEMNDVCREAGCRLVVVYAPTKAHVMLPAVAERLPAEKVRAFTALSYKKGLPEPTTFLANLLGHVDARESVVREWCRRESISFVSVTAPLRAAAVSGTQVYFTYDQHWTPEGHEIVAETVHRFLADKLFAVDINAATQ